MSLKPRVFVRSSLALLTVGFLALLAIVGATIWLSKRAEIYASQVVETRLARTSAIELLNAVQVAEASQRGFLYIGNEIYLAPYTTAKASAFRQMDIVDRRLGHLGATRGSLDRLRVILNEKFAEMDETISYKRDRQDEKTLQLMRTNRGKALTDEANIFISSIVRAADAQHEQNVAEQTANTFWLQRVSIVGGIIIVIVVGTVILALLRYTRRLAEARDEVEALNTTLEKRVEQRTFDLAQARDRAEILLAEVNHRVANSLSLVASLVGLQGNALRDPAAKDALKETQARIFAISSVHKKLYTSGDVRVVALDEYLASLLDHLETSMHSEGHGASLKMQLEPLSLQTDASINLGVMVAELVTNAFKYAYPGKGGEVRVSLRHLPDAQVELAVEDDGVGRDEAAAPKGTGLGTKIVKAMSAQMGANIQYLARNPGTTARLVFSLQPQPLAA